MNQSLPPDPSSRCVFFLLLSVMCQIRKRRWWKTPWKRPIVVEPKNWPYEQNFTMFSVAGKLSLRKAAPGQCSFSINIHFRTIFFSCWTQELFLFIFFQRVSIAHEKQSSQKNNVYCALITVNPWMHDWHIKTTFKITTCRQYPSIQCQIFTLCLDSQTATTTPPTTSTGRKKNSRAVPPSALPSSEPFYRPCFCRSSPCDPHRHA